MNANPQTQELPRELIGKPLDRVDGRLKVTGRAKYAAEFQFPNLAYAYAVQSTIARGRIEKIDTSAAEGSAGVLAVITHQNAMKLADAPKGERTPFPNPYVLQDDRIENFGQYIAVVVAQSFEQARDAA